MTRPTATPNDSNRALTPKLRFPEFRDAMGWPVQPLDSLTSLSKGEQLDASDKDKGGRYPHYNGGISPSSSTHKANREANTIIISEGGNSCGYVQFIRQPFWSGGHCYSLEPRPQVNTLALFYALQAKQQDIMALRIGSGLPNIQKSTLQKFELALPNLEREQQKIAECLSTLDELIGAESQKLDALKAHKKGLMQQLFPREGETLPRLRFPEFHSAPEWGVKKLDHLADFQSGGTPSKANPAFWSGSFPWVSAKDMKQLFLEDAEDHISDAAVDDGAKLVPVGTLLMLVRGMTLLKDVPICVVRREMSFNQDVKALHPAKGVDGLFLALLLTSAKDRLLEMVTVAGHGTGKLDTDELKAMELMLPSPAEQRRIATCLTSLDDLIAAQSDRLAALQTHKQGLLQQLFPGVAGASSSSAETREQDAPATLASAP